MIIIAFSLFGKKIETYYEPIIKTQESLLSQNYDFEIQIFHDSSVDKHYFETSKSIKLIDISNTPATNWPKKLWRYYAVYTNKAVNILFRDSDSIITTREMNMVEKWVESQYIFHIIRDSKYHLYPILAGTFGVKMRGIPILRKLLECVNFSENHFADQIFLSNEVYPKIKNNTLVHSSFLYIKGENCILTDKIYFNFVGAYANEPKITKSSLDSDYYEISYVRLKQLKYKTRPIIIYLSFLKFIRKCSQF